MRDFESSVTVRVSPEEAFRFLADPGNLPRYVATMVLARPEQGERLRVAADVEGRHEEGDARFRADPQDRRVEWGSDDSRGYRGWIQVSGADGGSSVTIHLHLARDEAEAEVIKVLDETVGNIERLLGAAS
jgi:uncharacterized protein YndB with AHSA1/START domain